MGATGAFKASKELVAHIRDQRLGLWASMQEENAEQTRPCKSEDYAESFRGFPGEARAQLQGLALNEPGETFIPHPLLHDSQNPNPQHRPCSIGHDIHGTGKPVVQEQLLSELHATGRQECAQHDASPVESREGQRCEDSNGCKQQDVGREFHKAVVDQLGKPRMVEGKQHRLQPPSDGPVNGGWPEGHEGECCEVQGQQRA